MFKKLKNCTFTQTQLDINGGVGIVMGFMIAKIWPITLFLDWYVYALIAISLTIPIWLTIFRQFSEDQSLERRKLSNSTIRWMD